VYKKRYKKGTKIIPAYFLACHRYSGLLRDLFLHDSPERQLDVVAGASGLSQVLVEAADAVEEVLLDGEDVAAHHRGPDGVRLVDGVRVDSRQTPREHARPLVVNAHLRCTVVMFNLPK